MRENFCGDIHAGIAFTPKEEIAAYRGMLTIRRFEEKAGQLYALGSVAGPCLLSIGREAAIVGIDMAAGANDLFITGPRCHGHLIARGTELETIMAELLGLETGLSGGSGGSVRMQDPARRFYGGHPAGGTHVPLAAGLALACRRRGSDAVTLCSLGDAVALSGQTFETLRLAQELGLRVLFIVDNNAAADPGGTDGAPSLADIGAHFGIQGVSADGIDVRKVRAAGRRAIESVRTSGSPLVLELMTYRYRGHAEPEVGVRPGQREDQDPIAKARRRLLEDRVMGEDQLAGLEKEVRDAVAGAVQAARALPGRAVA